MNYSIPMWNVKRPRSGFRQTFVPSSPVTEISQSRYCPNWFLGFSKLHIMQVGGCKSRSKFLVLSRLVTGSSITFFLFCASEITASLQATMRELQAAMRPHLSLFSVLSKPSTHLYVSMHFCLVPAWFMKTLKRMRQNGGLENPTSGVTSFIVSPGAQPFGQLLTHHIIHLSSCMLNNLSRLEGYCMEQYLKFCWNPKRLH